jgi:hypothetical protein
LGATALSVGALVVTIQTPGLSQFFGCRPLGPVGWAQATGAALGATGASLAVPWVIEWLGDQIIDRDEAPDLDPLASGFDNVVPLHPRELVK